MGRFVVDSAKEKIEMSMRLRIIFTITLMVSTTLFVITTLEAYQEVRIGVLAHKGKENCNESWQPTMDYLSSHISGYKFTLVPMAFDEIDGFVRDGSIEFIIVNPSIYVEMEVKHYVIRIATMQNLSFLGKGYTVFGGVIFTRADRSDINTISDLRGKKFMAVDKTSLGGWQMAWGEIKKHGIDPVKDFASIEFMNNHREVVYAVKKGKIDAATVRSDTLERMAAKKEIDIKEFKVIPYEGRGPEYTDFPFLLSTPLYPEWPIAKVKHTSNTLAKMVASALLALPKDSLAAKAADIEGWTVPLNYEPVDNLLKALRVSPYEDYGKVTWRDILLQHWKMIMAIVALILCMVFFLVYILRLNILLNISRQNLNRELIERKKMEEALKEAKEAAETANRTKSEFLASMSHEIRTPMNAIIGMASVLSETPLSPQQQQYVHVFRSAGENLMGLINDILDLSKVEAGHIELETIEFDLEEIVEKACEVLSLRAHEKGLELIYYIMPDVPLYLRGDPLRLRQIIFNLIGNAIKFTEKGEIVLRIENAHRPGATWSGKEPGATRSVLEQKRTWSGKEPTGCLSFSVSDTGIGIPGEKQLLVFDSFSQADSSTTRKYGGTGLGLTISKRLVELMGGNIWVESKPGVGSTFWFIATFEIPKEDKRPEKTHHMDIKSMDRSRSLQSLSGIKALVIDDNDTNRMILRDTLSRWGALVTEAQDGPNGILELKRAAAGGNPYDLLLLDCRMPGMDGFHVMQAIKAESIEGVTVMMLTSDNRNGDISRAKQLGIEAYLIKPVNPSLLFETIMKVMGKTKVNSREESDRIIVMNRDSQTEIKILLVDDYAYNRLLIQAYLKEIPCHIDIAENGEVAISKFKSDRYDIVLMDMQMPIVDGYTATKEIRRFEMEKGQDATPIIALTAYALKGDMQKSVDAGCSAYLTKPVKKQDLIETIFSLTSSSAVQILEDKGKKGGGSAPPSDPPRKGTSPLDPIILNPILEDDDNTDKANEDRLKVYVDSAFEGIVPDFLADIGKDIKDMRDTLPNGDYETIRKLGHRMKGAGGGYGFTVISYPL
ncbi:MAG: response regulator [Nitrospirae bacterium]|nr:response regulator [Nitrospirota bacterium]